MKPLIRSCLCAALVASTTTHEAFAWGAAAGPRGGVAYRGPMGGAAARVPNGGAAYRTPGGGVYYSGGGYRPYYRAPGLQRVWPSARPWVPPPAIGRRPIMRRRRSCASFPGITDNAQARECARTIAGWQPLPVKRMPKPPRIRRVR